MKANLKIITLYRYFNYSMIMHDHLIKAYTPEWYDEMQKDHSFEVLFLYSPPGLYLLYTYSGLYLVIEGWRELKLKDEKIEALLNSPYVERLRLFRNATFHYQEEPISWKHAQLFASENRKVQLWLNEVFNEFRRFFAANTLPIPEELSAKLNNKDHFQIAKTIQKFRIDNSNQHEINRAESSENN